MRFRELVELFGTAAHAWDDAATSPDKRAAGERAERVLEQAASVGARAVVFGEEDYPDRLCALRDPPPVLFALGSLAHLRAPCVAIVGTRRATGYGERLSLIHI